MYQCSSIAAYSCLLAILISCVSSSIFAEEAAAENPYGTDLSVTQLDIDIKTDFQSNMVDALVLATVKNVSKNTLKQGEFWLCPGGFNDPAFGADVKHVYLLNENRKTELSFTMRKIDDTWESYQVTFAQPVSPGQKVLLQFEYVMTGKPDHSSSPILASKEGVKEIYLRGGDYLWCPEPYYDIKAHLRMYPPGWTLRIAYPAGNLAVINGDLLHRQKKGGWIQDEWKSLSLKPGMPYVFVGPYKTMKWTEADMTFEAYVADDAILKKSASQLEEYSRIFSYYSELYGRPAHPVYRLVGSAVAGVGNSFTNGYIVNMHWLKDTHLNAHEMAHTWWGGLVSTYGEGGEFLSESMADFSARWILKVLGENHVRKNLSDSSIISWKQRRYCLFLPVTDDDSYDWHPLIVPANSNLKKASVRHWGALVVNQIRQVLGNETFFRCLKTFVDTYRGQQAGIDDFIKTINTVSGRDMTSLLKAMLWTPGYAGYRVVGLESEKTGDRFRTKVRIENAGDYGLPCPMLLQTVAGETRKTISVEAGRRKEFTYTTAHRVIEAIIDPDMTTLLQYHPEQKMRLWKAMLETIDGYGNNEAYGASYLHYVLGEFDKAVLPITNYLDKRMEEKQIGSTEEFLKKHGCAEYVFMRGIFYLASDDFDHAEKDIKDAFPHMLDALEHDGSVGAPRWYYETGAIRKMDLDEYLSLLGLIAGRQFCFEDGMNEKAKLKKVNEWKRWWEQKGRKKKLDLSPLKKRFEAHRQAFRRSVHLTD
jgi:hypothetical protein